MIEHEATGQGADRAALEEGGDEDLRLALCEATRRGIARSLDLLGVHAPEEM